MEPTITDWIVAISSVFAAIGVIFVAVQTSFAKKTLSNAAENLEIAKSSLKYAAENIAVAKDSMLADHDRSRRERALEILRHWNASVSESMPSARNLVETFDFEQCKKIIAHEPFTINESHEKTLEAAMSNYKHVQPPRIDNGSIHLDETHLFQLGFQCCGFLNALEIAIQGWLHHVGDEEIIEQELSYLVKPEKNYHILKEFRAALGGVSAYPAIHAFVEHIESKKTTTPARKSKLPEPCV